MLAEQQPGQQHGEDRLGVQEQRGAGGGHLRDAEHQQHRRHDATGEDRTGEPAQVGAGKRHPRRSRRQPVAGKAETGTEVEQRGQHPGTRGVQKGLRQWGAQTEQDGRRARRQDAPPP